MTEKMITRKKSAGKKKTTDSGQCRFGKTDIRQPLKTKDRAGAVKPRQKGF